MIIGIIGSIAVMVCAGTIIIEFKKEIKMRQEAKIIYAAIGEDAPGVKCDAPPIGAPVAESNCEYCGPKTLTYRELTKGAREIMALKAANLNVLFKEQNSNFPTIDEAKFIEFQFGQQALLGKFKVSYVDKGDRYEVIVMASWNGNSLKVF